MYQVTSPASHAFAEVSFYLGLALCSALGYIFVKLATKLFPQQVHCKVEKMSSDEQEEKPKHEVEQPQAVYSTRSRKKKADRKERKRQPHVLSESKTAVVEAFATTQQEPMAPPSSTQSASLEWVSPFQVHEDSHPNMVEDALVLKMALVELEEGAEEEMWFQTELSTSIMQLTCNATLGKMEMVAEKNRGEHEEEAANEEQEWEEQHPQISLNEGKCGEGFGLSIAELSTGDEAFMQMGEAGDESLEEEEEFKQELEESEEECSIHKELAEGCDASWYEESRALPPVPEESHDESQTFAAGEQSYVYWTYAMGPLVGNKDAPHDDAWMTPFEETMRSREEAEQVYHGMYNMHIEAEAAKTMEYQPVLCGSNQQLYTNGDQLYMLACVDESQSTDEAAPVLMRPVVDVCDPLHAEFAMDAHNGLDRLPSPERPCEVCIMPPEMVQHRPCMPREDDAWDVCW